MLRARPEGQSWSGFVSSAGHRYATFTFTVFVVSLPRMSMTLTTTLYLPASA